MKIVSVVKQFTALQWFYVLIVVFFSSFYLVENINGRFWLNDFLVYHSASSALLSGDQVYGVAFGLGSGYFKYSPVVLMLFAPLAVIPFVVAKSVYYILVCLAIVFSIRKITRFVVELFPGSISPKYMAHASFVVLLVCLLQFYYELHLGNINSILLLMVVSSIYALRTKQNTLAGVLLGIALLVKPHFLLLYPILFLRKKYQAFVVSVFVVIVGLFLPSVFLGWNYNLELLQSWMHTMAVHNQNPLNGFDTVYSLLHRFLLVFFNFNPSWWFVPITFLLVMVAAVSLFFCNRFLLKTSALQLSETDFYFEFFVFLALIPNLTVTDFEHFMFSMPLIVYLIYKWKSNELNLIAKVVVVAGFLLYGGNIRELVGKDVSLWMTSHGMLGLGNLIVVAVSVCSFCRRRSLEIKSLSDGFKRE
ncbi:MAG: glycosyltransferase family 87 protein [Bacteroidales bacterium]|nr:glycosyltransferase family 87 protein [Bacteroidales bacterium]MDD3664143.1 glycosyltransferase family 87 protein [Bacteroidales bacterium]